MAPVRDEHDERRVPALFKPLSLGKFQLQHRVVLAPMTRFRAAKDGTPNAKLMAEYYGQRSKVPGTLIITEATIVADEAGGFDHMPGIFTDEQVAAWKEIADAIHANGSFVFLQLAACGRIAHEDVMRARGHRYTAPSSVPVSHRPDSVPVEMSEEDVTRFVEHWAQAAKRAVLEAGVDGVEIHAGNGCLINQFLHEHTNRRSDQYGGTLENRFRFLFEVLGTVVDAVGPERTALRLTPWNTAGDMKVEEPLTEYIPLVSSVASSFSSLAYLHLVEPGISSSETLDSNHDRPSNDPLRKIWAPRPLVSCGLYTRESAIAASEAGPHGLIAFGRPFISNPDLPYRLNMDLPLADYDKSTFYVPESDKGYIDYPFCAEFQGVKTIPNI